MTITEERAALETPADPGLPGTAVPSWAPVTLATDTGLDAFRFSDDPVYEAVGPARTHREESSA